MPCGLMKRVCQVRYNSLSQYVLSSFDSEYHICFLKYPPLPFGTDKTTPCNKLEDYFVSTKSSYLGGDSPSASDVCVAIWMYHNNSNNAVMGPATTTWSNAVCSLAVIQEFCGTTEHITEQLTTLTMDNENPILAKLKEWNIPHSVYSHPLCHSAEELVATVPIPINDSHTKNLLLKDKKHGMFLFVVATKSHIDTKSLGKLLGRKS
jgi:Aminoacyl-tRNA editing domain